MINTGLKDLLTCFEDKLQSKLEFKDIDSLQKQIQTSFSSAMKTQAAQLE